MKIIDKRKFINKLKICFYILFDGKHERVLQYLSNRLPETSEYFYVEDAALIGHIKRFKEKHEARRSS